MAAKPHKSFPVLTAKFLAGEFDLYLRGDFGVTVARPGLVAFLLGGGINRQSIVKVGKATTGNAAWRELHSAECFRYVDESTRTRQAGGSQVETVRAALVKIVGCYDALHAAGHTACTMPMPVKGYTLTGGENGSVEIWRTT